MDNNPDIHLYLPSIFVNIILFSQWSKLEKTRSLKYVPYDNKTVLFVNKDVSYKSWGEPTQTSPILRFCFIQITQRLCLLDKNVNAYND